MWRTRFSFSTLFPERMRGDARPFQRGLGPRNECRQVIVQENLPRRRGPLQPADFGFGVGIGHLGMFEEGRVRRL